MSQQFGSDAIVSTRNPPQLVSVFTSKTRQSSEPLALVTRPPATSPTTVTHSPEKRRRRSLSLEEGEKPKSLRERRSWSLDRLDEIKRRQDPADKEFTRGVFKNLLFRVNSKSHMI